MGNSRRQGFLPKWKSSRQSFEAGAADTNGLLGTAFAGIFALGPGRLPRAAATVPTAYPLVIRRPLLCIALRPANVDGWFQLLLSGEDATNCAILDSSQVVDFPGNRFRVSIRRQRKNNRQNAYSRDYPLFTKIAFN